MVGRVGGGGAGTMGLVCVWSVGQVGTVRRRSPKRGRRAGEARGRITDDEEKSKGVRDEEVVVSFHGMCILPRKMMTFGLAKCTTGVDGHGPRDGGTPILLSGGGGHRPSSGQSPDRSCTPVTSLSELAADMLALLCLCVVLLVWWFKRPKKSPMTVPGPRPWPLIGSMHLLAGHETPFQAFTALSRVYGDIFSIHLGSASCVVVNSFTLIKEVLITKGADFGGRPDFARFHKLFGGDRNNSLALCDWSSLQKTRRSIARTYCSPRFTSLQYDRVNSVGEDELNTFLDHLNNLPHGEPCDVKPIILKACANMFTQYMCSTSFSYDDTDFRKIVRYFDEIFWEINQGYAVDFLPWLLPVYNGHMKKISRWAAEIRQFILSRIIDKHRATLDSNSIPRDFTDALLMHLEEDPNMNWQHIIFELEDFLGGHSAIGNLVMVTLAAVVEHPEVAKKIQEEVDLVTGGKRCPNLFDKSRMPYTEATILETLRTASSPIVPHVASKNTEIAGHRVNKGTIVFINNYELNQGENYWENPGVFKPERFLSSGNIVKPAHFIPFSTGKRTCIGQRLVHCFSFVILATLLQYYDVSTKENVKVQRGCVAVPPDCFKLILTPRK